jgi:hypothetical protein
VHGDATGVKPLESDVLAEPASTSVLQADAAGINGSTDAGLTPSMAAPGSLVSTILDNRLYTAAEISALLKIRKSDVYRACDRGQLQYVKFEGIVQVEGQDLKRWLLGAT